MEFFSTLGSNQILNYVAILGLLIVFLFLGFFIGKIKTKRKIDEERKKAIKQSRSVIGGQCAEQFAPFLPNFPGDPTEVRFIGKPIDYVLFKGNSKEEISEVVFIEVKTGSSNLSKTERSLKNAIENGKVSWKEYRIFPTEK